MKVLYFHCGTKVDGLQEGHRPVTVAGVLEENSTTLKLGVAQVSPCDVFRKSLGRTIAEGRAKKQTKQNVADGTAFTVEVPADATLGKFFVAEAQKIANSELTRIKYPPK